jgi:hypothetical protein
VGEEKGRSANHKLSGGDVLRHAWGRGSVLSRKKRENEDSVQRAWVPRVSQGKTACV